MDRPAFIYHHEVEWHETGPHHPETSSRTREVSAHVNEVLGDSLLWVEPRRATSAEIELVHPASYRRFIEEACLAGGMMVDSGETLVGQESYNAALLSAGGAITAVDLVAEGTCPSAFSCGRPPGHHATRDQAMGFCLFNNVAIAARYAQQKHGLDRVMIVDWDVHHGNGTQDIFYEDPSVLFCSIHQHPLYPGSGMGSERGKGRGKGFTINAPLPAGTDVDLYLEIVDRKLAPAARDFQPELIIISAGFDAHKDDPLSDMNLTSQDFGTLTRELMGIAEAHCSGRLVSVLEGGYNVPALKRCVVEHLVALTGEDAPPDNLMTA